MIAAPPLVVCGRRVPLKQLLGIEAGGEGRGREREGKEAEGGGKQMTHDLRSLTSHGDEMAAD